LKNYLTAKCDSLIKYFYPEHPSTDKCIKEIKSDQKKINEKNALIFKSLMDIKQSTMQGQHFSAQVQQSAQGLQKFTRKTKK